MFEDYKHPARGFSDIIKLILHLQQVRWPEVTLVLQGDHGNCAEGKTWTFLRHFFWTSTLSSQSEHMTPQGGSVAQHIGVGEASLRPSPPPKRMDVFTGCASGDSCLCLCVPKCQQGLYSKTFSCLTFIQVSLQCTDLAFAWINQNWSHLFGSLFWFRYFFNWFCILVLRVWILWHLSFILTNLETNSFFVFTFICFSREL